MDHFHYKRNNFDFLRFLAAICVLISHQFALCGKPEPTILPMHSLGGLGVLIFFSISGYLVASSWNSDPNLLRFGARRLLRIWPAFAVAVLFCALVIGPMVSTVPFQQYLHDPRLSYYLSHNLYFQLREGLPIDFSGNHLPNAINGSLWTIPLELKCYVALALLGLVGLLCKKWPIAISLAATVLVFTVVEPSGDFLVRQFNWSLENRFLVEFGLFFFTGVVINIFGLLRGKSSDLVFLGICWGMAALSFIFDRHLLALLFFVPATSLAFGIRHTPIISNFGLIGDLSYGTYIYAFPLQQIIIYFLYDYWGWSVTLFFAIMTTILLALVSWHLIEKRALAFKPRRRDSKARSQQHEMVPLT